MWHDLINEISALGWHAFLYGPEAWLVLPGLLTLIGAATSMVICYFTNGRK